MYRLCICYYSGHIKNIFGLAILSIPEDEPVSFASEDGEFSSEFTGEDAWSEGEWNEVFVLDALGEQEFIDFE